MMAFTDFNVMEHSSYFSFIGLDPRYDDWVIPEGIQLKDPDFRLEYLLVKYLKDFSLAKIIRNHYICVLIRNMAPQKLARLSILEEDR